MKKVNAWIMPQIITKGYQKSGLPGEFAITREKGRANRFQCIFQLGSIAACPADAERIVHDALQIMCWRIQQNWSEGKSAGGWPLKKPKKKGRKIPGIRRRVDYDYAGKLENKGLDGTIKYQTVTEKNAEYIQRQKDWAKTLKKNYTWLGELIKPPTDIDADNKMVGYWSGLMTKSLKVAAVRIKVRKGRVPQTVRTRITIAPSRGDACKSMKMFDIVANGDKTWQLVENFLKRAVQETIIFRNYNNSRPITDNEVAKKYQDFIRKQLLSTRILKTLNRTLRSGWSAL